MRGFEQPASGNIPLLDNHYRYSLDSVYGSGRSMSPKGSELHAKLHFADLTVLDQDPRANDI